MPRTSTSLPTREWIAKIEPQSTPEHISPDDIQRARIVWHDEFDNVFDLSQTDTYLGLSRKQICRMEKQAMAPRNGSARSFGGSTPSFGQRDSLLTDDCFVKGLIEGIDAVLAVAFIIGLLAIIAMAIHLRLKLWRSKRHGRPGEDEGQQHLHEFDAKTDV